MNTIIFGISPWTIIKIFASFAFFIYIFFAIVVVRQVRLMTNTLKVGLEAPLRFLALLHLAFSIIVFLFALFV